MGEGRACHGGFEERLYKDRRRTRQSDDCNPVLSHFDTRVLVLLPPPLVWSVLGGGVEGFVNCCCGK